MLPCYTLPVVYIIIEAYYNAFDAYHVRHDLSKMEGLFAGYLSTRLDTLLKILKD